MDERSEEEHLDGLPGVRAELLGHAVRERADRPEGHHAALGLITIAALTPDHYHIRLVDENCMALLRSDIDWADMICLSAMIPQKHSTRRIAEWARDAGTLVVLGGPYPSSCPEECASFGDVLVLDEGEITWKEFLADLEAGEHRRIYRSDEKPDITLSPTPRFDLLNPADYAVMPLQFSRGCPFLCEFCDIIVLFGRSGGFIVGFDSDGPDIFDRQIEFITRAAIPQAMIGPLTALPGTPLFKRLDESGRLLPEEVTAHDVGGSQGFMNVDTVMPRRVFLEGYRRMVATLYEPAAYFRRAVDHLRRLPGQLTGLRRARASMRALLRVGALYLCVLGARGAGGDSTDQEGWEGVPDPDAHAPGVSTQRLEGGVPCGMALPAAARGADEALGRRIPLRPLHLRGRRAGADEHALADAPVADRGAAAAVDRSPAGRRSRYRECGGIGGGIAGRASRLARGSPTESLARGHAQSGSRRFRVAMNSLPANVFARRALQLLPIHPHHGDHGGYSRTNPRIRERADGFCPPKTEKRGRHQRALTSVPVGRRGCICRAHEQGSRLLPQPYLLPKLR
jgi:hypothetical protein